jgi:hypothetical protein
MPENVNQSLKMLQLKILIKYDNLVILTCGNPVHIWTYAEQVAGT